MFDSHLKSILCLIIVGVINFYGYFKISVLIISLNTKIFIVLLYIIKSYLLIFSLLSLCMVIFFKQKRDNENIGFYTTNTISTLIFLGFLPAIRYAIFKY